MSDLNEEMDALVRDVNLKLLDTIYEESKKNITKNRLPTLSAVMDVLNRAYNFPEILRATGEEEFLLELIGLACSATARAIIDGLEKEMDPDEKERIGAAVTVAAKTRFSEAFNKMIEEHGK